MNNVLAITVLATAIIGVQWVSVRRMNAIDKRMDIIEHQNPAPLCPFQSPQMVTIDPCLKRCPVHDGICYRWNLCIMGIRKLDREKERQREENKEAVKKWQNTTKKTKD
jgi:hypothetical protein